MVSFPLSLVHGCCAKRQGPGRASWSPVPSMSHSDMQCVVLSQAPPTPLATGYAFRLPPVHECLSRELRFSWGKMLDPFSLILPSQVCPLAKIHSANSACPPHRAGLVNNSSLFRVEPRVSSVLRYVVSPDLKLSFFIGWLTGPRQWSALQSEGLGLGFH